MKKLICILFSVLCAMVLMSCSADVVDNQPKASDKSSVTDQSKNDSATESYESIFDEYSKKLKAATPTLIEEYNKEAANNSDGLSGLAKLSNNKVSELAKISTDGTQKMAALMYKAGNGSYSEYEEWAGKLQEVYTTEAGKIQQAYMDSAK